MARLLLLRLERVPRRRAWVARLSEETLALMLSLIASTIMVQAVQAQGRSGLDLRNKRWPPTSRLVPATCP